MFVCCVCCVSGRGLCYELITRPEKSYRLWCVVVCDLENLKNEEAMTRVGSQRHSKKMDNYKILEVKLFSVCDVMYTAALWCVCDVYSSCMVCLWCIQQLYGVFVLYTAAVWCVCDVMYTAAVWCVCDVMYTAALWCVCDVYSSCMVCL